MAVNAAVVIDVKCKNLSMQSKSKGLSDGAPFKPVKQKLIEIVHKHGRLANGDQFSSIMFAVWQQTFKNSQS